MHLEYMNINSEHDALILTTLIVHANLPNIHSLLTLRKPRSPLRSNGQRGFLRLNSLAIANAQFDVPLNGHQYYSVQSVGEFCNAISKQYGICKYLKNW